MQAIVLVLLHFALVLPMPTLAFSAESDGNQIFASEWIQPSEASLGLIEIMFKGQVSTLPRIRQDTLDKSLKSGDWATMDTARHAAAGEFGAEAVLDWLATRHLAGHLGASTRYGLDLFNIGKAVNMPSIIEESVGIWLYIYGLTLIDGHKCTDPSSPKAFINQTMDAYADVRTFAATLSKAKLDQAIEYAVMFEKLIAPDRVADPMICTLGEQRLDNVGALNDAMNDTLKALEQHQNERATTGEPQTKLPEHLPPSWIKPQSAWQVEAAAAREVLPGWLSELTAGLTAQ